MSRRVAIVTGGGSGIGAGIARRLATDGLAVAALDLDEPAAVDVAASIDRDGGGAIGLGVDVTDRAAVDGAVARTREAFGRPGVLVNCAGRSGYEEFLKIDAELWERQLAVNVTSAFHCCQATIPEMLAEGWGRIVNISSSSIHRGVPRMAPYVSAKSAVIGLTKSLALEFAPHGITVNAIPPGFVDTPALRRRVAEGKIDLERQTEATPVRRIGRPDDIAAACSFLVGEDAGYVTGQVLGVDGGRSN